jgi:hypothetical protein
MSRLRKSKEGKNYKHVRPSQCYLWKFLTFYVIRICRFEIHTDVSVKCTGTNVRELNEVMTQGGDISKYL